MKQLTFNELRLDVDYLYNLNPSKFPAYWNINKNGGKITFHLGEIWDHSQTELTGDIGDEFDCFLDDLIFYDLSERICLERAHEKIKIKGGHCKPCCVKYYALLMMYPFAWDKIKEKQGRTPDQAKLAGLIRLPSTIALSNWVYWHTDYGGVVR